MNNSPGVAVVVLNWNGYLDTLECVKSIFKSNYSNFFIHIIDNGSEQNEIAKFRKIFKDKVTYIQSSENLGYAGGNNYGINKIYGRSAYKYYFILNNDTVIRKDTISKLIIYAEDNSNIALIGATIMDYHNRKKIQCRGLTFNIWSGISLTIDSGKELISSVPKIPQSISGTAFLVRREFFDKYGLFDEDYFCYYEDLDLSFRTIKYGYRIAIAKNALVYHKGSVSASKINGFSEYQLIKNRFLIEQKNATMLQKINFIIITILLYLPFHIIVLILSSRQKNISYFIRGFYCGLLNFKL